MGPEILNCLGNPSLIREELVRWPGEGYCPLPPRCDNMRDDVKNSLVAKFPSGKTNTGQEAGLVKQKTSVGCVT